MSTMGVSSTMEVSNNKRLYSPCTEHPMVLTISSQVLKFQDPLMTDDPILSKNVLIKVAILLYLNSLQHSVKF